MVIAAVGSELPATSYFAVLPKDLVCEIFKKVFDKEGSLKSVYRLNKSIYKVSKEQFYGDVPCERPIFLDIAIQHKGYAIEHEKILPNQKTLPNEIKAYSKCFTMEKVFSELWQVIDSEDLSVWDQFFIRLNLSYKGKETVNQKKVGSSIILLKVCKHVSERESVNNQFFIERLLMDLLIKDADPNQISESDGYVPLAYLASIPPNTPERADFFIRIIDILIMNNADPKKECNKTTPLELAKKYFPRAAYSMNSEL